MRTKLATTLLAVGAIAAGWWFTRPPPPARVANEERKFEDFDRAEYEAWMQELGYTD